MALEFPEAMSATAAVRGWEGRQRNAQWMGTCSGGEIIAEKLQRPSESTNAWIDRLFIVRLDYNPQPHQPSTSFGHMMSLLLLAYRRQMMEYLDGDEVLYKARCRGLAVVPRRSAVRAVVAAPPVT